MPPFTSLATIVYKDPLKVQWGNSIKANDDYFNTGVARFWVKYDGATSTVTAVASHNLSSITDNATAGCFTFTFTTGFATTNYACVGSAARSGASTDSLNVFIPFIFTTASVTVVHRNASDGLENPTNASVVCWGVSN